MFTPHAHPSNNYSFMFKCCVAVTATAAIAAAIIVPTLIIPLALCFIFFAVVSCQPYANTTQVSNRQGSSFLSSFVLPTCRLNSYNYTRNHSLWPNNHEHNRSSSHTHEHNSSSSNNHGHDSSSSSNHARGHGHM